MGDKKKPTPLTVEQAQHALAAEEKAAAPAMPPAQTVFDPDRTFTVEEMAKNGYGLEFQPGKTVRRTSAAAHRFLKESRLIGRPASNDAILWDSMILNKAKGLGRTLNLAEVKELVKQRAKALEAQQAERAELVELTRDESGPESETCAIHVQGCEKDFEPKVGYVVVDGRRLKNRGGAAVLFGSYIITPENKMLAGCPNCIRQYRRVNKDAEKDIRTYPRAVAEEILERGNRSRAEQEMLQSLARDRRPRDQEQGQNRGGYQSRRQIR